MLKEDLVREGRKRKFSFSLKDKLTNSYFIVVLISAAAHGLLLFVPISSETKEVKKPEVEKVKKKRPKTVKLSQLLGDSATSTPKPSSSPQAQPPQVIVRPSPTLIIPPRRIPILASPSVQPIIITPTPTPIVRRAIQPPPPPVQPVFTPTPSFVPTPTPVASVRQTPVLTPTPTPVVSITPTPTPVASTTPTPTPVASISPTPTPVASTTPTPMPVASISPTLTPIASATPTAPSTPPINPFEKTEQYDDPLLGSDLFAEPQAFFTAEGLAAEQNDSETKPTRLPNIIAMDWQKNMSPEEVYPEVVEKDAKSKGLTIVPKGQYGGGELYELQQQGKPLAWISLVKTVGLGKGTVVATWRVDPKAP